MTEVVDFIDFISCGMNRVNLVETKNQGGVVVWFDHYADIVRDDKGRIVRITLDGEVYDFTVDATGIILDVSSTLTALTADIVAALSGHGQALRVTDNDLRYDGTPVACSSFTQPAHGTISDQKSLWMVCLKSSLILSIHFFLQSQGGCTRFLGCTFPLMST